MICKSFHIARVEEIITDLFACNIDGITKKQRRETRQNPCGAYKCISVDKHHLTGYDSFFIR